MNDSTVLAAHQLSKNYGSRPAVNQLDLEVHSGEIFGFLGPNGAGKTTTIRMALGLVRPTSGRVDLLGRDVSRHGAEVLPRVGALVEAPALYGYMSGRDNLRAFASVLGGVPGRRLDEVLELVDLDGRQKDRVKSYSLGMKQRLGLAVALLHDPELLVLDEPANGLDPAGIVEMRDLMRRLAAAGKTIFVSSHVLAEVQQICDRVAIINLGRLVRVAPVADLVGAHGEFAVRIESPARALELVRAQPWGAAARIEDGALVTTSPTGRGRDLLQFLAQAGLWPDALGERQHDLEEIFLELTSANGGVN
ncbi:ABC transporter ATP-binding protein [Candidatus Nephthysia bennettiae]|uniref:ABC transporter ATP-binding protein n=1 Tax=Candidatus Nephthysia bennettiae TaxID=3127016 RepID=UPI0030C6B0CE